MFGHERRWVQGMSVVEAGGTVRFTGSAVDFVHRLKNCACVVGVPQKQPAGVLGQPPSVVAGPESGLPDEEPGPLSAAGVNGLLVPPVVPSSQAAARRANAHTKRIL